MAGQNVPTGTKRVNPTARHAVGVASFCPLWGTPILQVDVDACGAEGEEVVAELGVAPCFIINVYKILIIEMDFWKIMFVHKELLLLLDVLLYCYSQSVK